MTIHEQRLEIASASSIPADMLALRRMSLVEELGRPYEAELEIVVDEDGGLSDDLLVELLRHPAVVRFGERGETELHGIFRSIAMLSTSHSRPIVYRARLVPRLWELSQLRRSRIFQDGSVVDAVAAVLAEIGLTEQGGQLEWRLTKSYPVSEYTVQYEESDLDFVQRLLEHHGIFYWFDQLPDGERIVIGDDNRAFTPLEDSAEVPYDPRDDFHENVGIIELARELVPQPATVLLREYNWRTPSVPLQSEAPGDRVTGRGLYNSYGEHFKDPGAGAAIAATRAEELMCRRDVFRGRCRITNVRAGRTLDLVGHPLADLDQTYVVTRGELSAEQSASDTVEYVNRFTALPQTIPFRPERRTPKPSIPGIMHARVDGEQPGTAAPIDEWGRYKILFPFDLAGQSGGRASRWVRLAQPASGPGFGIHFPLHIGVEVAVAHLGGDPDRPIILSSPPNTETVTPVNRANATQSAIRTQAGIKLIWDDDC